MSEFSESSEQDGNGTGPDVLLLFMRGVVRFFPWLLVLILVGAVGGVVVGLAQPNRYASNAKLILRMGAREQLTSESLVDLDERQRTPPPTMVDEMQMLSDIAIFERVASELGPGVVSQVADPERDDGPVTPIPVHVLHVLQSVLFRAMSEIRPGPADGELRSATKILKENTTVFNEPGSSVILVSSTSTSPETARTIVQALTSAFIERHRDQFSIQSLLTKSRSQLEEATRARDEAAKAYVAQVSQSGIVVLETQVPRLESEVSSLESEQFAVRVRREEISRLQASLTNRLHGAPAEGEVPLPFVMVPNDEYESLLARKRLLVVQKKEMLLQGEPSGAMQQRAKEFDDQIAKVDQKFKTTPKSLAQGSEVLEGLGHTAMEARIVDLKAEDETLIVKLGLLESRLDTKRTHASELQKQLLTATMSRKDLGATRDAEESRCAQLQTRLSVLEALQGIDGNGEANLRLLQAPTLEHEKVGPKRGSLLLRGLLFGLLAAIAFAILRQHFERRLCYPESFENERGVPVLGVVPHFPSLRSLERRKLVGGR